MRFIDSKIKCKQNLPKKDLMLNFLIYLKISSGRDFGRFSGCSKGKVGFSKIISEIQGAALPQENKRSFTKKIFCCNILDLPCFDCDSVGEGRGTKAN